VAFNLVDTGGIELLAGWETAPLSQDSSEFMEGIVQQARIAIQDADVVVLVVDGQVGLTNADREVAEVLRRSEKPTIVAANKLESTKLWDQAYEFYELGLGVVCPVSALHGTGVGDFLDEVVAAIPPIEPAYETEDTVRIAIVGKPNVGKSTLLNRLLGEERAIVSPLAGTTRDAIDSVLRWHGQQYTIVDTAGIRRRGKIEPGVEKYSVLRAMPQYVRFVQEELKFMPYAPILFISAETGQRVSKIMSLVNEVQEARHKRIPTGQLNKLMRDAVMKHPPPQKAGVRVKFFYATQAETVPPTFVFFVNKPDWVHFSYQRYLENQIREMEPFTGTPIRLRFRARSEDRHDR
jgi:GTP-binding protein